MSRGDHDDRRGVVEDLLVYTLHRRQIKKRICKLYTSQVIKSALSGGRSFFGRIGAQLESLTTLTFLTGFGQSRSASAVHCILACVVRRTIRQLACRQCRSGRLETHMQAFSGREVFVCQKLLKLGASADLIRLHAMPRSLFLRREDFCDLTVSPFADVVVLCFHTMYPSLDLVAVVLNQENGAVQVLSDDG